MYLDAVVDVNMHPLFNGTPGETSKWLTQHKDHWEHYQVVKGHSLEIVSVERYLGIVE